MEETFAQQWDGIGWRKKIYKKNVATVLNSTIEMLEFKTIATFLA